MIDFGSLITINNCGLKWLPYQSAKKEL